MIGFVGLAVASLGFYRVHEPASIIQENRQSLLSYIRNVPATLRKDKQFRRFIVLENLASFGIMIMPFYMIFARDTFQSSQDYLGRYLLIQVAGTVLSSFIWGLAASRKEARIIVRICLYLEAVIPIAAILFARTNPLLYGITFFLIGFTISGRKIGFEPYLLDIAPADHRTQYLGIRGTLNIFTIILPIAGGFFIGQFGYKPIFIIVSAIMIISGYLAKKQVYDHLT